MSKVNLDLTGRRALVCGASRGIGAAIARSFAAHGASVTLLARNPATLDSVREALAGGPHAVLSADLDRHDELLASLDQLGGDGYSIIVNNTGGPPAGPLHQADTEAFEIAFNRHVLASQRLLKHLLKDLLASQHGRILNVISTSVYEPIAGLGVSNTIRAAMAGWAKTLADELAPGGITINNLLPGFTQTDRLDNLIASRAKQTGQPAKELADGMRKSVPVGRFADPSELAGLAVFLASDAGAYITGQSIAVDGGRLRSI